MAQLLIHIAKLHTNKTDGVELARTNSNDTCIDGVQVQSYRMYCTYGVHTFSDGAGTSKYKDSVDLRTSDEDKCPYGVNAVHIDGI